MEIMKSRTENFCLMESVEIILVIIFTLSTDAASILSVVQNLCVVDIVLAINSKLTE